MNISDYYSTVFRSNVSVITAMRLGPLPGTFNARGLEHWLDRIPAGLHPFFLVCLYFTVLVDQAMYDHFRTKYQRFTKLTRYPKFCFGLGHYNPREILSIAIDREMIGLEDLHAQLLPGMRLFVAETTRFFLEHMPDISAGDFFEAVVNDPDVQAPLDGELFKGKAAKPTDRLVFDALERAIKDARSK